MQDWGRLCQGEPSLGADPAATLQRPIALDGTLRLIDAPLRTVDESQSTIDGPQRSVDESQSTVDGPQKSVDGTLKCH